MLQDKKAVIKRFTLVIVSIVAITLSGRGCTSTTKMSDDGQRVFSSPDDAVKTLVTAARDHDEKQIQNIFGPDSEDMLSSGDAVADQQTRERFLQKYDEKHRLVSNSDGSKTLELGNDDWPLPIPLVKDESTNQWVFDTEAGKDEIINRRIGRNELDVIEVCKAIGDAQREYAQRDPNGDGIPEYARKFISDAGTRNGLYWEAAPGEAPSPLGALAAEAQGQGYSAKPSQTGPRPYHGYLYRILTRQGKDAPGGAQDYVINGKLIGGFAVVAWPADYGNSGIMTFIANYTGDVYQKDLGDDTDKLARSMEEYNPDASWKKQEESP